MSSWTSTSPAEPPHYATGLDLGQQSDFAALVVVERHRVSEPASARTVYRFDVRHLHRWPLKTPYPQVVADVKELFADRPLAGSTLVLDETGVGRAVTDMVRAAGIRAALRPYSITSGSGYSGNSVAKKHLVGAIQAPLCDGRLRFAAGLALTPVLMKELQDYRVKVTADRNETFSSWRERDHDDLVMALALALFVGNVGEVKVY